jgi:circadian clock protein KaiB
VEVKPATVKSARSKKRQRGAGSARWMLRLYIAGNTPRSIAALNNLRAVCEEQLNGRYRLDVIDLLKNPLLARKNQILAVPTLVRKLPLPVRRIIGDLSDAKRVLVGLDLVAEGG